MSENLSAEERKLLLNLARQAVEQTAKGEPLNPLDLNVYSPLLREEGATFVTLTRGGKLRGCIGALEAYQPLVEDVREHAAAAAVEDWRFPPVQPQEVPDLRIEISRLTRPVHLDYRDPIDLVKSLRPGVDGVILRSGEKRATFLPQVWDKLPDPVDFLNNLCEKMGDRTNCWQKGRVEVLTYQVESFEEDQ